ncbi:MAG TPA: hypothetical protein ENJ65_03095 [Candidatus Tenderia electrophaga]|uniref:Spondin domain-containing protein n=1 Tax=Candidatus Tenderia electrophaga TaxID=1748243 RepID=A0A832N6C0_9GAMM|nr:hypothetical protein [Candidatus Tenderia electrophaga]
MKKQFTALAIISGLSVAPAMAQDLDIKITNLTNAIHFTPLLVAAHDSSSHLFMAGSAASSSLQAMAEGGDISGLATDIQATGGNIIENPAAGLLAPGSNTSFTLMSNDSNTRLSLTAMMLPTNDGFVGIDSLMIPSDKGIYTYYLNGYDAGTEANDELISGGGAPGVAGIPADPGGHAGTGGSGVAMADSNTMIHIHRGNLGDSDANAGSSDLDSSVHRWLNPVAELVITIN